MEVDDEGDQFYKDAKLNHKMTNTIFTEEEIELALVSNAGLFFFAGFENSSMGMAISMYYLAKNPTAQNRLYEEICDEVEKTGSEYLDYDTVQTMPFLDQVHLLKHPRRQIVILAKIRWFMNLFERFL